MSRVLGWKGFWGGLSCCVPFGLVQMCGAGGQEVLCSFEPFCRLTAALGCASVPPSCLSPTEGGKKGQGASQTLHFWGCQTRWALALGAPRGGAPGTGGWGRKAMAGSLQGPEFCFFPPAVAVNPSPGPGLPLFQAVVMFCSRLIYFWGGEAAFAGAGQGHSTI